MNPTTAIAGHDLLSGLPGESLIRKGLSDSQNARVSVESCLVEIAGPRLARAGLLQKSRGAQNRSEPSTAFSPCPAATRIPATMPSSANSSALNTPSTTDWEK